MPGPPPKPRGQRQRTNRPTKAEAVIAAKKETKATGIPALGDYPSDGDWEPGTVEWWSDLWASEIGKRFLPFHIHGLRGLALLVDTRLKVATMLPASAKVFMELTDKIRLTGREFWINPVDMARSSFPDVPEETKPAAKEVPEVDDPRRLRVVS